MVRKLLWGLAGELAWLLVMMGICRFAFNRGVRRYKRLRRMKCRTRMETRNTAIQCRS